MISTGKETYITQIRLPSVPEHDMHPRLQVDGRGVHCGEAFQAYLPDRSGRWAWSNIRIELDWDKPYPACWVIPGRRDISPVGLFVLEE